MHKYFSRTQLLLCTLLLSSCTDNKGLLDEVECRKMKVAASCYTWAKKLESVDMQKAIEIHELACRMDHTEGCVRIGDLLAPKNLNEAHSWYKRACEQKNPSACIKQAEALLKLRSRRLP